MPKSVNTDLSPRANNFGFIKRDSLWFTFYTWNTTSYSVAAATYIFYDNDNNDNEEVFIAK